MASLCRWKSLKSIDWVSDKCGHMDADKLREKGAAITVSLPEVFIHLYASPPGGDKSDEIKDPEILMAGRVHAMDIDELDQNIEYKSAPYTHPKLTSLSFL